MESAASQDTLPRRSPGARHSDIQTVYTTKSRDEQSSFRQYILQDNNCAGQRNRKYPDDSFEKNVMHRVAGRSRGESEPASAASGREPKGDGVCHSCASQLLQIGRCIWNVQAITLCCARGTQQQEQWAHDPRKLAPSTILRGLKFPQRLFVGLPRRGRFDCLGLFFDSLRICGGRPFCLRIGRRRCLLSRHGLRFISTFTLLTRTNRQCRRQPRDHQQT